MADLLAQLQNGRTLAQVAAATGGKSSAGLISALVAHERQELADAVSAGRLTQAQADRLDGMLEERVGDFVNGVRPPMPPGGHHPHGGGLEVAATYLGTSTEALATQLRSGKTLAQVASATSGKSAAGLIDALVADVTTRFGGNAPSDLRRRITDLVNGTMAAPDLRGGPGHWGPLPG
jgi:hypothetical protein